MATDATEQFLLSYMPVSPNKIQTAEVQKPTKNLVIVKPCISPCFCLCKDVLLTQVPQDISKAEVIYEAAAAGQTSCHRAPVPIYEQLAVAHIQKSDSTQVRRVLYVM